MPPCRWWRGKALRSTWLRVLTRRWYVLQGLILRVLFREGEVMLEARQWCWNVLENFALKVLLREVCVMKRRWLSLHVLEGMILVALLRKNYGMKVAQLCLPLRVSRQMGVKRCPLRRFWQVCTQPWTMDVMGCLKMRARQLLRRMVEARLLAHRRVLKGQ